MPTEKQIDEGDALPTVNAHNLSPERTVFTEDGNEDGWISTDLTVPVSR